MATQAHADLPDIVDRIDPAECDYTEWTQIGMALKACGFGVEVWDSWSAKDTKRYHQGECAKKWATFDGEGVGSGTIIHIAEDHNVDIFPEEEKGRALGWDEPIDILPDDEYDDYDFYKRKPAEKDETVFIDRTWVEGKPLPVPSDDAWDPIQEIATYISTLFEADEYVGYVMESWEKDGRYLPSKGSYARTSSEILRDLDRYHDIGKAIGDYNEQGGAWIRFNALDGQGVRNSNVAEFRYALVESDSMSKEMQYALMEQLELPIAALVDSGNKSLHAIVRVDATDYAEYKKRVDSLYEVCKKNGLNLDTQNKNPSRLSRLPGVMRGENKQYLVATNIGKESWAEWWDWIQAVNDDLPDPEGLSEIWDDMPQLAPPLIDGVLRQGHKMLIAGPSKAGKSYALIELCAAIAEGKPWFGWQCAQGRVLYVNLELDRPSALHRFRDVYTALGWAPTNIGNIDVWNLRGKSVPMDKLAPKLIRRSAKKDYIAVVIDPIYKVITGDENSADQMAAFCNSFDLVASQLGCAVIYCHHHSKGAQGSKRSMDRASGSGVFARDPDALIDMSQINLTDDVLRARQSEIDWLQIQAWMNMYVPGWKQTLTPDEQAGPVAVCAWAQQHLTPQYYQSLLSIGEATKQTAKTWTAWRLDGTLREFPKFDEKNLWFQYPLHLPDYSGALNDLLVEGEYVDIFDGSKKSQRVLKNGRDKGVKSAEARAKKLQKEKNDAMKEAFKICKSEGLETSRDNILTALNDNELFSKVVTKDMLRGWTRERTEWSEVKINKETKLLELVTNDVPLDWDGSEQTFQ